MPLKKVTPGSNMYQGWITDTHTHLAGECPHKCIYCYAQKGVARLSGRYKGEPRLVESELNVNYGSGKIIFIEHMQDLFAEGICSNFINDILQHCNKYPDNIYIFQSKNPEWASDWFHRGFFPKKSLLGSTIETNRNTLTFSNAPCPVDRYMAMKGLKEWNIKTFITIEPIMDFDIDILSRWIINIKPEFVNIGADSKNCHLPEPSADKIQELIKILTENKIVVKKKSNLWRLLK